MERKFLITSILIISSAIAFLSGYLLMPDGELNQKAELITKRFNSSIEIDSKDKTSNTLPLSSRGFLSFVNPYNDSQKIIAVDKNGNIVEINTADLSEKTVNSGLKNLVEVMLSPAGDSLVYSYYDTEGDKKHAYLNFKKGGSTQISGDLRSAAFSPQGDQIAYLLNKDEGGELLISKGVNIVKQAFMTRLSTAVVSWPADFISIITYDKGGYGDLFILNERGDLNKILSYQYDLKVKWSPDGKIIFSAKGDSGLNQLFYKDVKNNGAVIDLGLNTDTSRCVWVNSEEIVCGLRNQGKVGDEFYKINLNDGSKTLVATPTANLVAKEVVLNRSGDILYLLNSADGQLYSLKIKP